MHHHSHTTGKVLTWSTALTIAFVAVEASAGFYSGSLALISDAGHNFADALALILAAVGLRLQSKPADDVKTFGYHRAGVLAAFVNALTLVLISLLIVWEAWQLLLAPHPVNHVVMLVVAAVGLAVNGAVMLGLHSGKHDLNIRAAYIHMMGDALGSIAIIAGAIAIRFTGWQRIDPLLSIAIAALIVWSAWGIIRESLNVLLEGLPRGMSLHSITSALRGIEGIVDVHDLHIWSLGSNAHALSCHVLIEDMPPSESNSILLRLNDVLCGYEIRHTTIQFEHVRCALSDSPCSIAPGVSGSAGSSP